MLARIGKYEIRDELGKGGFGQVYLGLDPTMDRLVAIKVLSAGGDSSLLIRFQTEATAAGNLNHKNIVTVYEFGEDRGMFFWPWSTSPVRICKKRSIRRSRAQFWRRCAS